MLWSKETKIVLSVLSVPWQMTSEKMCNGLIRISRMDSEYQTKALSYLNVCLETMTDFLGLAVKN